jgi:hypothetical protein
VAESVFTQLRAGDIDHSNTTLLGRDITYRIAVGPHQVCKVYTLQTLLALGEFLYMRQLSVFGGQNDCAGIVLTSNDSER